MGSGGYTECRAGSQRSPIISSREDRYVTRINLMDQKAMPRSLIQELGSFARQQVSARTVRRRLQQHGSSAQRQWLWLPFVKHPITLLCYPRDLDLWEGKKKQPNRFYLNISLLRS
ncbi:HTH_Tnp_Tc3_2 domain-containing protein [Trichonephila clavipes]|nr:HTH_Tnp_Tc3_2 domain-containing protein [Trichonephila clavipes]